MPKIYLIHGEEGAKHTLQRAIKEKGWNAFIPHFEETIRF
ncbi:MAG: MBL fold metallo-hydrolase RNA specificity domain-containing protein [Pseudomonadota bacterium]|nr:MBL fold metallo-hydrolase RNA specificity domain-containing protein [Pseudomonadota bacterium]